MYDLENIFAVVKRVSNSGNYRHVSLYVPKIEDNNFEEGEKRITMQSIAFEFHKATGLSYKQETDAIAITCDERQLVWLLKCHFAEDLNSKVTISIL